MFQILGPHARAAATPLLILALTAAVALLPAACGGGEEPIHPGIDNQAASAAIAGQEYIVILAVRQHQVEETAVAMHQLGYELDAATSNESNSNITLIFRRMATEPEPGDNQ